jgi:thymidylate synthase ThyX
MNDVIWVDGKPYFWPFYDITRNQIMTLTYQHGNGVIDSYIVQKYLEGINCSIACYENIVCKKAIPSQDARQLFPHALLTNLFWSINMKALKTVYNQRWCCCAESSTWLPLLRQVKEQIITACGKEIGGMLTAPIDRGESCGYNSKLLDQPCKWRK